MNLKQNKGVVGVDIAIALIVLMILIPLITGLIFNVNSSSNSAKTKSQALNIAVNTLEIANEIDISELTEENVILKISEMYGDNTLEQVSDGLLLEIINITYKLQVFITDYSETNVDAQSNVVKTVKAQVTYNVSNEEESIDISTVITK